MLRDLAAGLCLALVVVSGGSRTATVRLKADTTSAVGLEAGTKTVAIRLLDLDNHPVDPFLAAEDSRAIVFLFASIDCPISNRYAPAVQRLHAAFAPRGVSFYLVYPNPAETPDAIRAHVKAFAYPVHVLRDPNQELVKLTKVKVTPEAAVYDRARTLAYHGRIDDRYVSLGVERPAATRHDLENALEAVLAGKPVREAATQAVGCFIVDFVP